MPDTLNDMAANEAELDQQQVAQQQVAQKLLAQAKEQGVELVGPDGLLNQLTKRVLETALEEEMAEHLGYESTIRPAGTWATRAMGCGRRRC